MISEPSLVCLSTVKRPAHTARLLDLNCLDGFLRAQSGKAIKEIDLKGVPLKTHRLAAQLLVDSAGTEVAPTWTDDGKLLLDPTVRVLYRLDVDGPAYYEFRVTEEEQRLGFIVVSTGRHDFPVPHWSSRGSSPTELLDEEAESHCQDCQVLQA